MQSSAEHLRSWEIPELARFEETPGGLVRLVVTTARASAEIYLNGAHVTQFQPTGEAPVLFMSQASLLQPGKAIRGGVPVIFPWFGGRAGHPESPAHGFARTSAWEVESLTASADGPAVISLVLTANEQTRGQWSHEFLIRHRITVDRELTMVLEVENLGTAPFEFEEALHTYLSVSDVRETATTGLAGIEYIDKVDGLRRKVQEAAPIRITGETDRVYLNTKGTCSADDPGLGRRLEVAKEGSDTTVVWNPWIAKAAAMADFGNDEWPQMLCIETANAAENAVTLAPGARHAMTAIVRVAPRG